MRNPNDPTKIDNHGFRAPQPGDPYEVEIVQCFIEWVLGTAYVTTIYTIIDGPSVGYQMLTRMKAFT